MSSAFELGSFQQQLQREKKKKDTQFKMKFITIAAIASIAAVANTAPATPTGVVTVSTQSSVPLFQEIQELEKDVQTIVQDVQAVVPLVFGSGNTTYPEDLKELISAISKSIKDVEGLVDDITSDLGGIFGLKN